MLLLHFADIIANKTVCMCVCARARREYMYACIFLCACTVVRAERFGTGSAEMLLRRIVKMMQRTCDEPRLQDMSLHIMYEFKGPPVCLCFC